MGNKIKNNLKKSGGEEIYTEQTMERIENSIKLTPAEIIKNMDNKVKKKQNYIHFTFYQTIVNIT